MRAVNKQEFEAIVSELEGEGSRTERAVSGDAMTISGGFEPVRSIDSPSAGTESPAATSWGSAPSMGSSWSSDPQPTQYASRLPSGFAGGASGAGKSGTPDGRR